MFFEWLDNHEIVELYQVECFWKDIFEIYDNLFGDFSLSIEINKYMEENTYPYRISHVIIIKHHKSERLRIFEPILWN